MGAIADVASRALVVVDSKGQVGLVNKRATDEFQMPESKMLTLSFGKLFRQGEVPDYKSFIRRVMAKRDQHNEIFTAMGVNDHDYEVHIQRVSATPYALATLVDLGYVPTESKPSKRRSAKSRNPVRPRIVVIRC